MKIWKNILYENCLTLSRKFNKIFRFFLSYLKKFEYQYNFQYISKWKYIFLFIPIIP